MPWHIRKSSTGKGYYVVTTSTGQKHSSHPLDFDTATKQLRALYAKAR